MVYEAWQPFLTRFREVGGSDPARFKSFKARFANIVYPGMLPHALSISKILSVSRGHAGNAHVEGRVERWGG
jgi:hypothetical protein